MALPIAVIALMVWVRGLIVELLDCAWLSLRYV
jgi:hypothetical protein